MHGERQSKNMKYGKHILLTLTLGLICILLSRNSLSISTKLLEKWESQVSVAKKATGRLGKETTNVSLSYIPHNHRDVFSVSSKGNMSKRLSNSTKSVSNSKMTKSISNSKMTKSVSKRSLDKRPAKSKLINSSAKSNLAKTASKSNVIKSNFKSNSTKTTAKSNLAKTPSMISSTESNFKSNLAKTTSKSNLTKSISKSNFSKNISKSNLAKTPSKNNSTKSNFKSNLTKTTSTTLHQLPNKKVNRGNNTVDKLQRPANNPQNKSLIALNRSSNAMKTLKKGSVLKTHKKSRPIYFRPFLQNPRLHNITVEGNVLPGPFYDDQLFLLGLRLTSSYEKSNSQVHVDVFGFPGNIVGTVENRYCDIHSLPRQWNLNNYSTFATGNQTLYCQLECRNSFNTFGDCGAPIPMEVIPFVSGDVNQNSVSLIWRCNVTDYLNRSSLIERSKHSNPTDSVRVSLYINDSMSNEKSAVLHNISQIDIPLHTAVAGYGGPQIRPTDKSYFTEIQDKPRIRVGMCVSIYQSHPAKFFPEFIQHHKNIGIEQILVGVDAKLDSSDLEFVEAIIQPYINEGLVVMQAFSLNDYFKCHTDVPKIQFYHQCLYHFKGITKYIVTWDIDEYWIPPNRLETSGINGFKKYREGKGPDDAMEAEIDLNKTSLAKQRFITKSPKSSFPTHVTNDVLWQRSNYSKSIGIHDVIQAIDQFHIQHGCRDKWCFHLFPSYTVAERRDFEKENFVARDFLYRESQSNLVWKKSLTQTRFAMMNGFHIGGSCKLPSSPNYFAQAEDTNCFPISWIDGEFGSIHHYLNLIASREDDLKSNPIEDEYVIRFGNSVLEQLKEINRTSLP